MTDDDVKDLDAELGELLRFYRLSAGKSEKDIAKAASLPKARISGLELGKAQPSVACLYRIAGALGIPASELLIQLERRLDTAPPVRAPNGSSRTLEFMVSNRGRQLIRALSQCDDPKLLDAFANLFLAASLQKKTDKTEARRPARVGN